MNEKLKKFKYVIWIFTNSLLNKGQIIRFKDEILYEKYLPYVIAFADIALT